MNKFLAIVVAVLCIGLVRADVDESDVLVGTQENFEELLAGDQPALVEFYAPWCGHCKKLVPEYARAATLLKGEVKLIKVDATVETDLASQYNIQGYPTLKFFKNGKLAGDFDGERNSESMAAWCRKRSGPAAATLADQEAVDAWTAKNTGTRVIAFVAADSAEAKTFLNVAGDAAVEEFAFAMIHDETLARNFGASNMPSVVIKKGSDTITFDDEFDTEDLIAWTLKNGYPAIEELSQSVFKRASASSRPLFVGFTKAEGSSTVEQQSALYESIANDLSGKAMFSFVAHDKFPNLASQWGASGNKYPTAVFVTWSGASPKIRAFDEAEDFTAENVKTWITECLAGNCKAFRKSEEIPESNDGPVTVVVGKTFETIVLDETKDVFVEFYAPWCGHCKKLEGPWKQLGEKFENVESVVIAKSDATANGYPDTINVRGFPTLIFFPANDKSNPITYEGDRDVAGFEKFILEKASIKIDASKLGASSAEDHDEL